MTSLTTPTPSAEQTPTRDYRICTRCVMDTTDPDISFADNGECSHCRHFDSVIVPRWNPGPEGRRELEAIFGEARRRHAGRDYDCIMGLSGGLDSSYVALVAREFGLRVLAVHVDGGWNSEVAVSNIEKVTTFCGFDLHTHVVDWEEMRDLQLAFLRSGVVNQDFPQDHVFFAVLYKFAQKHGIRTVLTGANMATESILPGGWVFRAMDRRNLLAIHRRFGDKPLHSYETIGLFRLNIYLPFVHRMKHIRVLDYIPYDKATALSELSRLAGYRPYGRKHGESRFTRLYQNYILPTRYGYDKRRPHLASLILSGQMTREEAIAELAAPPCSPAELEEDLEYFCRKMEISRGEFDELMAAPRRTHESFANQERLLGAMRGIKRVVWPRARRFH